MRSGSICALAVACICVSLGLPALAQSPDSLAAGASPASSQPGAAGVWYGVTQLAPNTRLKISATHDGGSCVLQSASADSLVCRHGSTTRAVPRTDIKSIKLARRGRSAAGGLGIGAAAGAAAGAGIGSAINSSDSGTLVHVSGGKSAGVGAGVGVIIGAGIGALVGHSTDFLAGPVIYKRQP